ncbi:hypothetical protein P175DRAFT_0501038 [Aspergillus ochraceoroseus IBT 24754]|uniref:Uncharacterized protein n=1 Tax=Aspergillus ochraceoroseus IBT 24754 TaxID=1392256 RepID=A0A2T5M0Y3_9EURO|nr:uncharacterized protein P175DRAFT_0501038 [Aspergillus ochraceoroseus IBT 24754]PTU22185.1 hypothetical protein P175DRAFT_0501038 [Aspergillus ochraceoroseus IBT 24754]
MLRSALPLSVFAITVGDRYVPTVYHITIIIRLTGFNIIGKQPGHESSSCPRPRTTESKGFLGLIDNQCRGC